MTFTPEQVGALGADLDRRHVKGRQQAGRTLSYIESWHAIAEANRIFGFDGWTSETVECRQVAETPRDGKPGWSVSYIARIRVTVQAGDRVIVREGVGAGHGIDASLGQAHESAIKEAESDARKRALMTFGNPFGLALYDKTQAHVADNVPAAGASLPGGASVPQERQERIAAAHEANPHRDAARAQRQAARDNGRTPSGAERAAQISRQTRDEMLSGLEAVDGPASYEAWKAANGKASGKWQRLNKDDSAAVMRAYKLAEGIHCQAMTPAEKSAAVHRPN